MIYPSADKLENWGSKYSLVVLAAKRAKQIKGGAPPLIQTTSRNPLTIALEEIAAGVIHCQVADHDILPKTSQETEVAQLLAIPTHPVDEEEDKEADAEPVALADDAKPAEDLEVEKKEDDVDAPVAEAADVKSEAEEIVQEAQAPETEPEPVKPKRTRKKKAEPEAQADDAEPKAEEESQEAQTPEPEAEPAKPKRTRKKKAETEAEAADEVEAKKESAE